MSDKLQALIKVKLKIALAPSLWEGRGRGAATAKRKTNYLRGLSARAGSFWISTR